MKYWGILTRILTSFLLAVILFVFPLSAQAASSSSITRSIGDTPKSQDFSGKSLVGVEYTNVKFQNSNFSHADLRSSVFNGSLLKNVNLHNVDFSGGIAYLTKFQDCDLSDALLTDAMLLRSTFDNVNVTGADFTNAVLDRIQVKRLCVQASGVNSKTGVDTRESLGCN